MCEMVGGSPGKTSLLDPIPVYMMKQDFDLLVTPITRIINTSLTDGVFSSSLKQGIMTPLLKKSTLDHELFSSYRPITNIAFLAKTLERVVSAQTRNVLLAKLQSGYRLFHSTETAILRVVNDILLAIDSRREVILVLLDLSSAFDHRSYRSPRQTSAPLWIGWRSVSMVPVIPHRYNTVGGCQEYSICQ